MVEYWTYALFFCVAELWGPIVISLLFWTLANEVCTVQDARTIYPLMGIAANIALVVAGVFIKHVTAAVPQARHITCLRRHVCSNEKSNIASVVMWVLLSTLI